MKKSLIIALAGFMLLAFTQCGGGGSKEFQDAQKLFKKLEKEAKNAKTCEELEKAEEIFWNQEEKEYAEKDRLTDEEREKLADYFVQIGEIFQSKSKEFGCKK